MTTLTNFQWNEALNEHNYDFDWSLLTVSIQNSIEHIQELSDLINNNTTLTVEEFDDEFLYAGGEFLSNYLRYFLNLFDNG